jgi:putative N6-adenine-specific DNA methylase
MKKKIRRFPLSNKHPNVPEKDFIFDLPEGFVRFFATGPRGLETLLKEELDEIFKSCHLKARIWEGSAGCYFEGSWACGVAANMASMCASRVLCVLGESQNVHNAEDLYQFAKKIPWTLVFDHSKTFSVSATIHASFAQNSLFVSLRVKDAICDVFRHQTGGERPTVDPQNAQVKIFVRLFQNNFSISVDTTGKPLSKRGYRVQSVQAPLGEALAASLLRMSGWNKLAKSIWNSFEGVYFERKQTDPLQKEGVIPSWVLLSPFLSDPMCGSGTFVIEAALALLHWKPNAHRSQFAFQHLLLHQQQRNNALYTEMKTKILSHEKSLSDLQTRVKLYAQKNNIEIFDDDQFLFRASDCVENNILIAKQCASVAGVQKLISFAVQDVFLTTPHASYGIQIINPPYGERLAEEKNLLLLYKSLGDLWKQKYSYWSVWLLSANESALKCVGLRPTRKIAVYNGNLQCKFLQYVMYPKQNSVSVSDESSFS